MQAVMYIYIYIYTMFKGKLDQCKLDRWTTLRCPRTGVYVYRPDNVPDNVDNLGQRSGQRSGQRTGQRTGQRFGRSSFR